MAEKAELEASMNLPAGCDFRTLPFGHEQLNIEGRAGLGDKVLPSSKIRPLYGENKTFLLTAKMRLAMKRLQRLERDKKRGSPFSQGNSG
jgi:hypothetical protein